MNSRSFLSPVLRSVVCFAVFILCGIRLDAAGLKVVNLTCENTTQPLGIDVVAPLLAWQCQSDERGAGQEAYQILVSKSKSSLQDDRGEMWNTGWIASDKHNNIAYRGHRLQSSTRYYWKVRVRDLHGNASEWSQPQWFETALMNTKDLKAVWISDGSKEPATEEGFYKDEPAPQFQKQFTLSKKVASARLYISGLGYHDASINGCSTTDAHLQAGWTSYAKTILYNIYDVTSLLHEGLNRIDVLVGNGFFNPLPFNYCFKSLRDALTIGRPMLLAQLQVTYTDGSQTVIATGRDWKVGRSAIVRNSVYLGEQYDARLEDRATQSDSLRPASLAQSPGGRLIASMLPPVRATKVLKPVRMTESRPGVFVFDMGQNFAGVARLHVKGPCGTRVTLRYGEDVYSDGSLNGMTSVGGQIKRVWNADRSGIIPQTAYQIDTYTLKGEGNEVFEPRFTFHGFRYVEVTGFPGRPTLDNIEGIRLCSDLQQNGSFECSDEFLNRLSTIIDWTFLSNVFSVQSDCPHREKLGYGGDLSATLDSYIERYDMANYYLNTIRNFADAQRPNGGFSETAPYVNIYDHGLGGHSGPIGWQLGFCKTIDRVNQYYGNRRAMQEYYPAFRRQVEFMRTCAKDNLMNENQCLGDHEALAYGDCDNTNYEVRCIPVSATAHYYYHVVLLAHFAQLLGYEKDYQTYTKLAQDIKQSFIKAFCKDDGTIGNGSQSAMSFGLYYGLYPENIKAKVVEKLLESIHRADDHIHTGFFGTELILPLLSQNGYSNLAYKMVARKDFPSFGYMLAHGATTVWETWHNSDNIYSKNHPMFGSVSEWMYRCVLGLTVTGEGSSRLLIEPLPPTNITWARGTYRSVNGPVNVSWKREGKEFILDLTIPVGTTADLRLPGTGGISSGDGITNVRQDGGIESCTVASGTYHFSVKQ